MERERHEIVVVGAGQAGLAAAAMLKREGLRPVVLERGPEVGARWRTRYDRLQLHTIRWLSSLPGYRFPRAGGKWPPRDAVVDYLARYAERYALEVRIGVEVERIDRTGDGWRLQTSAGPVEAEHVVVATGYNAEAILPDWPGRDSFAGTLVHSGDYRNAAPFRGLNVLVVGAGNSAAEIAVDLAEGGAAKVRMAVRTPPHIIRRDRFGVPSQALGIAISRLPPTWINRLTMALRRLTIPDLAPYGLPIPDQPLGTRFARTWMIPILDVGIVDAVMEGRVEIVAGVERFEGAEVVLADGSRLAPDTVVAATGFRPGLETLAGHLGVLDERGRPAATTPAPGLHFIGFTVTLGGAIRRVGFEAKELARAIATESTARATRAA